MPSALALVIAVMLVFSPQLGSAQDLSRYRAYVLESSLASVVAASGARAGDARTLHDRPAKIQELEWRAPYVSSATASDPVRGAVFTFCDDALYQIVVSYDSGRTAGLTNSDIIESVSAVYGLPVLQTARSQPPAAALPDTVVLAQWDSTASSLTMLRNSNSDEFQLILTSKASSTRAQTAIREAGQLDVVEGPRRVLEQRKKDTADANAARDKIRVTNKAAFRP